MHNLMLILAIIIGVAGQIFLKMGSVTITSSRLNLFDYLFNYNLCFGIFLYGVSTIFYIFALQKIPLSIAYPTISFGYIFVMLFSAFFFKEKIEFNQILGVLLIIFGVYLIWRK